MKLYAWMSRCRRTVLSLMVCWMIVLGLVVVPSSPALAQKPTLAVDNLPPNTVKTMADFAGFADVLEMLSTILTIAGNILSLIGSGFDAMFDAFDDTTKGLVAVKNVDAEVEKRMVNLVRNSNANDKMLENDMTFIMEHTPPKNAHLCRKMIISQGAASGQGIVDAVAHIITDAYISAQRGIGQDEAGPRGTMLASELRCLNKYGNPIDGYPESCFDLTTKVGTFKRTFVDADILASTIDGAVTLEIPRMDSVQYELADGQAMVATIANPQNNEQKMWIAAMNYCLQMAGPKPTPPAGRFANTQMGVVLTGMYRSAIAKASAHVEKCGRIVGYYSRPNADMTDQREAGNKVCRSAIGKAGSTNYLDQITLNEKFGGCTQGLSKYQMEYLDRLVCKSPQSYMLDANSGALTPEMMDQAVACGSAWNLWELNTATLQGSLVDLTRGFMKVRKEFNRVQAGMNRGPRASADDRDASPYLPASSEGAGGTGDAHPAFLQTDGADTLDNGTSPPVRGTRLPDVVNQ